MPVYLELLEDDYLLRMSTGLGSIAIVACGACPNESLAYARGIPLAEVTTTEEGQSKGTPYAITQEVKRLAGTFRIQGLAVKTRILDEAFLCLLSDNECAILREELPSSEAILALCCPAGAEGLKAITKGSMQILLGMEPRALLFYQYRVEPKAGVKYITQGQLACI